MVTVTQGWQRTIRINNNLMQNAADIAASWSDENKQRMNASKVTIHDFVTSAEQLNLQSSHHQWRSCEPNIYSKATTFTPGQSPHILWACQLSNTQNSVSDAWTHIIQPPGVGLKIKWHQGSHFFNSKGVFSRHSQLQLWRASKCVFTVIKELERLLWWVAPRISLSITWYC